MSSSVTLCWMSRKFSTLRCEGSDGQISVRLTNLVLLRKYVRLVHKHFQVHAGILLVGSNNGVRQLNNGLLVKVLYKASYMSTTEEADLAARLT